MIEPDDARELLSREGWLSRTSEAFRKMVICQSKYRRIAAGESIVMAGDASRGLFGLAAGGLGAFIAPTDMDVSFAHFFGPGSWFGEIPILNGSCHVVGLRATRETALLHLPPHKLKDILGRDPGAWRYLGQLAAEHTELCVGVVGDLMRRNHAHRLIAILMHLAGCRMPTPGGAKDYDVDVSQEDLATLSNLARSTVNTILSDLHKAGILECSYRRIRIADVGRMRALINNQASTGS